MRPGPARGESATLTIKVTPTMSARVAGREIHPVYGTAALVEHIEQVCRVILEPHLEDGEEGVGHRLELLHRAPVPIGAEVMLAATVADVGPNRVVCEVVVRHDDRIAARGTFEQRVVRLSDFRAEVGAAATR